MRIAPHAALRHVEAKDILLSDDVLEPRSVSDTKMGGSQEFWTYENWIHKYSRVHAASCSFCNDGRGVHDAQMSEAGRWLGPFPTVQEARVASDYHSSSCGFCAP